MCHALGVDLIETAWLIHSEGKDVYHHYTWFFNIQRCVGRRAGTQTSKILFLRWFSDHIRTGGGLYDPR